MFQQETLVKQPVLSSKWLIEDILPSKDITLLYSLSTSSIYTLMLDWAFSIATGQAWLNREAQARKVLCVTNQQQLKRIASAWSQEHGCSIKDNLIFISPQSYLTYQYSKRQRILQKIQNTRPAIAIFDSRISICTDNQVNVQRATEEFLSICTELQYMYHVPVLIVHYNRSHLDSLQLLKDTSDTILQLHTLNQVMYLKREKPLDLQCDIVQFKFTRRATPVI